ncbi:MAG: DUF99 family protein [Polyangiaceae bacterium]|nr:DUF99 family protein [Polyangiaceae bacterium]
MSKRWSHVIGVDDAPFSKEYRGNVLVVGVAMAGARVDGVLSSHVRRDGRNAADALVQMILPSQFYAHLHAILLQGIALAGFNVVDIHQLSQALDRPVLVMARHAPDMNAVKKALLLRVRGGKAKWKLIEKAGPMERVGNVFVQRAGLTLDEAGALLQTFSTHGNVPEPLRLAHLIAGGVTTGRSRGRA